MISVDKFVTSLAFQHLGGLTPMVTGSNLIHGNTLNLLKACHKL